jgi:hypothetical protein
MAGPYGQAAVDGSNPTGRRVLLDSPRHIMKTAPLRETHITWIGQQRGMGNHPRPGRLVNDPGIDGAEPERPSKATGLEETD